MRLIDISMTITETMQVYKDDPKKRPVIEVMHDFSNSTAYGTKATLDMHTGTHLDRPLHMLAGGKDMSTLLLDDLIGSCKVFDLTNVADGITEADLMTLPIEAGDFVLFKTRNSFEETFNPQFIFLKADGASYLAAKGIRGVGIDGLGIERSQPLHETHEALLGQEIHILEGLRLAHVAPGSYQLIALPIKMASTEAAPVRAVLIQE